MTSHFTGGDGRRRYPRLHGRVRTVPARPVTDADLTAGPRQLVKKADAHGWWTVGTVGSGEWATRSKDADDEPIMRVETSLLIRGRKGGQRFAAIWRTVEGLKTQPLAVCYWWCVRQRVDTDGGLHEWTAPAPTPHPVNVTQLKKLLEGEKSWTEVVTTSSAVRAGSSPAGSVRATRKVRTDGVS